MNSRIIAGICMLLIVIPIASALGISPGRRTWNYEPNSIIEGSFSIINSEHRPMFVKLQINGHLKQYLVMDSAIVRFSEAEEMKIVSYKINLPAMSPVDNLDTMIIAQDISPVTDFEGTGVIVMPAVATQIAINFDKPRSYVQPQEQPAAQPQAPPTEGQVQIVDYEVQTDEEAGTISLVLGNEGGKILSDVVAELIIYGGDNNELLRLSSNKYSINPSEKVRARISFETSKLQPGTYKAKLIVHSGQKTVEKDIEITAVEKKKPGNKSSIITVVIIILIIIAISQVIIWRLSKKKPPRLLHRAADNLILL